MKEFRIQKLFNWQIGSERLIRKYVADLYQTGMNIPVATVLANNTDVAFTYDYIGIGTYMVTASKPLFTGPNVQKVQATITNATFGADVSVPTGWSVTIFPVFDNIMIILTTDLNNAADGILGNNTQNAIEITIYP